MSLVSAPIGLGVEVCCLVSAPIGLGVEVCCLVSAPIGLGVEVRRLSSRAYPHRPDDLSFHLMA